MNTDELIHNGFLVWEEENELTEVSDEELFTAGAGFIINYLINTGKLLKPCQSFWTPSASLLSLQVGR